jgi:hypothetical protein
MQAQLKTWIMMPIITESLVLGTALSTCGRSTMTVSVHLVPPPLTDQIFCFIFPVTLSALPSAPLRRPLLAKNVLFGERGENIMVFYLESHEMYANLSLLSDLANVF